MQFIALLFAIFLSLFSLQTLPTSQPVKNELEKVVFPTPKLPFIEDLQSFFAERRKVHTERNKFVLDTALECHLLDEPEQEYCLRELLSYSLPETPNWDTQENESEQIYEQNGIVLTKKPHQTNSSSNGSFTKYLAQDIGIEKQPLFTPLDIVSPFAHGRGIASGDSNNDGEYDIAIALENGIALYEQQDRLRFREIPLPILDAENLNIFIVTFVDINNDGWQDLFFSSYGGKNGFLLNRENSFDSILWMPESERLLTLAAAFSDLDQDGDLDVILGNWSGATNDIHIHRYSKNELFLNENGEFVEANFSSALGETLSVIASDIDQQYGPDILIANDFAEPDTILLSTESGGFAPILKNDNLLDATPFYSMGWDTADIDNDLDIDLFGTDMSFLSEETPYYCDQLLTIEDRIHCQENYEMGTLIQNRDAEKCLEFTTTSQQEYCLYSVRRELARFLKRPDLCEALKHLPAHERYCKEISSSSERLQLQQDGSTIEQITQNVLLINNNNTFTNIAEIYDIGSSNWSWNAKIADFDNDSWQDIYIGNGFQFQGVNSNVFFHNQGGKSFVRAQNEFGLEDYINTPSFSLADFDKDGDLDFIASGVNAPYRFYENKLHQNAGITFSIKDELGNRNGIGTKIIITYGENAQEKQLRELKLGGGYLSFDAPLIHFGLAETTQIESIEIIWSTGETTLIETPLEPNNHYVITRQ